MLHVENISHRFPGKDGPVEALDRVSFDVAAGEFVCILGPSGCGKTTLLHILAGLVAPTEGRVILDGEPVTSPSRDIGLVFQQSNLMPWRSVRDNLALPLELAGVPAAARQAQADKTLDWLGLEGFAAAFPAQLSGGMAQRVAIGRALIYDPRVLLLDEPFGALDALTREQIQLELLRLWSNSGKTAIMVTHSINEATLLADRVLVMSQRPGHIRAEVHVGLPRPRRLDMIHAPEFGALARQIRANIEASGDGKGPERV
jgi:NitT/TauT family transport system ATP-binding protein